MSKRTWKEIFEISIFQSHVLQNLKKFTNQGNGSEIAYVVRATKIILSNLNT